MALEGEVDIWHLRVSASERGGLHNLDIKAQTLGGLEMAHCHDRAGDGTWPWQGRK